MKLKYLFIVALFIIFLRSVHADTCIPNPHETDCLRNDGGEWWWDADCDCVPSDEDNCEVNYNPFQEDVDADDYGDVCDNCVDVSNPDQRDADNDGIGDACEEGNHAPEFVTEVQPKTVDCDAPFPGFQLHVRDVDPGDYLRYGFSGNGAIGVSISESGYVTLTNPGFAVSRDITFTVYDLLKESDSSTARFTVDACSEATEPTIALTDKTLSCSQSYTIDLRNIISDDYDTVEEMMAKGRIRVIHSSPYVEKIDSFNYKVVHPGIVPGGASPADVTIRATNSRGKTAEKTATFIFDSCKPSLVIPYGAFNCDAVATVENMHDYVKDENPSGVTVSVDGYDGSRITAPELIADVLTFRTKLAGDTFISFHLRDTAGKTNTAMFKFRVRECAEPYNYPPEWVSLDVPDLSCGGHDEVVIMAENVHDDLTDFEDLIFRASSDNPNVKITPSIIRPGERDPAQARFRIEHVGDQSQTAHVVFIADDSMGGKKSIEKDISVTCNAENQRPMLKVDPDRLDLSCSIPDSFDIITSDHEGDEVFVTVNEDDPHDLIRIDYDESDSMVTVTPRGTNGQASVIVTANDNIDGHADVVKTVPVTVTGCGGNTAPTWNLFTIREIPCGTYRDFIVTEAMVHDDHTSFARLIISAESLDSDFTVEPAGDKTFRITHVSGESDSGTIRFTADDREEGVRSADRIVSASCDSDNHDPILEYIEPLHLSCDGYGTFDIDASDNDPGDDLTFDVGLATPSGYVRVEYPYEGDKTRVYVHALGREKTVTIPVRVDDGNGGSDSQNVYVYIDCDEQEHEPPVIGDVASKRISCDDEFADFTLHATAGGDEITYDYAGQGDFDVEIDGSRVSIDNPGYNYKRKITFIASSEGGTDTTSATFEVYGCEDEEDEELDLDGIPDQTVCEGDRFDDFDLEDYVDADDNDLDYSFSGEDDLEVDLDGSEVSIDYPRGFIDREYITFKVRDSNGNSDTEKVSFRVEECDGNDWHYMSYDVYVPTIRFVEFKPTPEPFTMCTIQDRLTRRTLPDADCDGLPDDRDNCPTTANPKQADQNTNGIGDACDLAITSFDITPKEVGQGGSFAISAGVRNKMGVDLKGIRLVATVDGLGVHVTKNIDFLLSGESDTVDMMIDVPECTSAKKYVVKLAVEYLDQDTIYSSGPVTVVQGSCFAENGNLNVVDVYNMQDIPPGGNAVFPLKITNPDPYAKSYTVRLIGVDGWGTYWFDTGSVVIVPAYSERTVNAFVASHEDTPAGERTIMAEISHGSEVRQVVLVASVKGQEERKYSLVITILQIVLVLLVLAAVVIGIVALLSRRRAEDRYASPQYY
jgi:hypothetical protein